MLEIRNLRHVYPNGYEALKSVSMRVEDGQVAAVIGRSGAGKSTLLRCINGLERPVSGSIEIDGTDIVSISAHELRDVQRRVGFIWQEYNLIDRLSVMQNVLAGRLGHRRNLGSLLFHWGRNDRDIAIRSLERVNMLHRARHRADRLSGGEKQRVGIARALSQEPKVLLADEPVASLDPELSEQVIADLAKVARDEGVPTLINLHDVELATEFCDKVIAVAQGMVVYEGPTVGLTDEVLNQTYRFDREWKSYVRGVIGGSASREAERPREPEREVALELAGMRASVQKPAR
jgi:phosphonate transport system ATP-binding protein